MDADTRHQLKQNELAEALSKLRSAGDKQLALGIGAVVVLLAAIGGYTWWSSSRATALENAWEELSSIRVALAPVQPVDSEDQLRTLIAEQSDPMVAASARLLLAQTLVHRSHDEPARREALLNEAVDLLQQIVDDAAAPAPPAAAATYALGTAYESLRQFDQARVRFADLADNPRFAGSPFQPMAAEMRDSLDEVSKTTVEFIPGDPPAPPKPELPPLPATRPTTQPGQPTTQPDSRPAPPDEGSEPAGAVSTSSAPAGPPPAELPADEQP